MKVKRFVAADMRRALDLVKQEMGPDAVILSTNRTKQGVEVITSMAVPDQWGELPKKVANDSEFSTAATGKLWRGRKQAGGDEVEDFSAGPLQSDVAWGNETTLGYLMEKQRQKEAAQQAHSQPLHSQPAAVQPLRSESSRFQGSDLQGSDLLKPDLQKPSSQKSEYGSRQGEAQIPAGVSAADASFQDFTGRANFDRETAQDFLAQSSPAPRRGRDVNMDPTPTEYDFPTVADANYDGNKVSDVDNIEKAAAAHQNLQAAMREFEQAYQAITRSKVISEAIDEREQIPPAQFVPPAKDIKSSAPQEKTISDEAATSQPDDTEQAGDAVDGNVEQANTQQTTAATQEEPSAVASWWNSAFQFSSYQVNYNPEYQLYLGDDSGEEVESATNGEAQAVDRDDVDRDDVERDTHSGPTLDGGTVDDGCVDNNPGEAENVEDSSRFDAGAQVVQLQRELEALKSALQGDRADIGRASLEPSASSELPYCGTSRDAAARNAGTESLRNKSSAPRPKFTLIESPSEPDFAGSLMQTIERSDPTQFESLKSEIADMRELLQTQLDRLATDGSAPRGSVVSSLSAVSPVKATIKRRLQHLGLNASESDKLLSRIDARAQLSQAWTEVLAVLAHRLPVQHHDLVAKGGFFAFVGSPGCGKTATVSKLAARHVLQHGSAGVAIVSLASRTQSSQESLQRLGKILSVPVHIVRDIKHLSYQLDDLSDYKLVLIDTAGLRHGDPQLKSQLSALRQLPQVKNILVLAANTQLQMMKASIHAYRPADLEACVLSKLDDTVSLGEAFTTALEENLPLAYTTSSQDFTKGIDLARPHQLVARSLSLLKTESRRQQRLRRDCDPQSALS